MMDFRCKQCNRLLAKVSPQSVVEIKCPRCKDLNRFSQEIFITIEEGLDKDRCTETDSVES
ncbi:MAG: Com family DNA-binding transcriptional regulator [Candidatus Saganbacteria bacterium]|nr:Com family DNA-binding transcriptional regulator [Candidatus Saganbacteria bacterium]